MEMATVPPATISEFRIDWRKAPATSSPLPWKMSPYRKRLG